MSGAPAHAAGGVLGVDPGLRATGWGVLKIAADGSAQLAWGVLRPSAAPLAGRLAEIYEGVSELIERYRPAAAAVERPFVRHNVRTAVALGQAEAAAMIAASRAGLEIAEYAPRAIREAVVGDGGADKRAVAAALAARLQLARLDASNDAADALAVAYCHVLTAQGLRAAAP